MVAGADERPSGVAARGGPGLRPRVWVIGVVAAAVVAVSAGCWP